MERFGNVVHCIFPYHASLISVEINENTGVWVSKRPEIRSLTSPAYLISASETDSSQELRDFRIHKHKRAI